MKKLPVLTGYDVIKALRKAGFIATRQRGSHVRLKKIEEIKRSRSQFQFMVH
jgi:predicted RNA binding protein YcfA (HicA-like mRNA interferase family)